MFAFSKVFGGLRVAVVLHWEKIRHVYQLLFVEVLRRTHHRLVLVAAEITLHMLHVYEVGTLGGVSNTTSRTRSPKLYESSKPYFYMFNPVSVPDLRPELIRFITF